MDQMLDTDAYVYKRYALWLFSGHPESRSGHALQRLLTAVGAKAVLAHIGLVGKKSFALCCRLPLRYPQCLPWAYAVGKMECVLHS